MATILLLACAAGARAEVSEVRISHGYGVLYVPMVRVGTIKAKPAAWKELFFPLLHALPGS
jgi:hypothetical protein